MAFLDRLIAKIRLHEVSIPLRVPFAISGGTLAHRRSLIVELISEEGVSGFGEAAPFDAPFYSAETLHSVSGILRDLLIPRVLGERFASPIALRELLSDNVRGNHMARAAIDTAWWDLQARLRRAPLHDLVDERLRELGVSDPLRGKPCLLSGAALGLPASERIDDLRASVHDALKLGFRRIKLKVRPGWTAEPVRAALDVVRESGSDVPVSVDGNGAFRIEYDRRELEVLDELGLVFIEQPFGAECLWDARKFDRHSKTPICLDESLTCDDVARQVIDMSGPLVWNLKVQRLGGLEETCRVYARGLAAGAEMWVGTMPETGLGAQSAICLGGLKGLVHVSDIAPSNWWFGRNTDLVEVEMNGAGEVELPPSAVARPRTHGFTLVEAWG